MKIKVCGMRDPENVKALLELPIDFIGFIFYKKSKRFVEKKLPKLDFRGKERVGVFVNADLDFIEKKSQDFDFQTIQLHGEETPRFCKKLKEKNFKIIKAFAVNDNFDFSKTKKYEPFCDYFLFDTKGKLPGGNGVQFNWEILKKYMGKIPFFLSGGINPESVNAIKSLKINQLYAIDLNSGFEDAPAMKNIDMLKNFMQNVTT